MKISRVLIVVAALIIVVVYLASCSRDPQKAKAKYLSAGQNYMKRGQYGDASIEFRNALRLDPRFVEAYYQLALADLAQHEWSTAYASLEKAIELDPTRLDARLDRGRLYLAARQFRQAGDEANFILERDPKNIGASQLLGAALMGEQKPDQALAAFSKTTELLPNSPSAYVNMALVEISMHRSADAERDLKKAVAVDSKAIQAYIDLANFYELENRREDAQQTLQAAIDKNPEAISPYVGMASIALAQGQQDEADAVLENLHKRLPNSPDAALAIGDFYSQHNKTDQALTEYRRGLSVSPKNIEIKKHMLDLYLETKQIQAAVDLDRDLTKNASKDVMARVDHGRLLLALGKPDEAIIVLQKVVADAADSPEAHYFLAMAYWQNGELARATTILQDTLKISPGLSSVLQALARLSLAQSRPSDARSYAHELVQRLPANPVNRQLLAEALVRQGQFQAAQEQILIANQLTPNDPTIHLNLAELYSAEKKSTEAQNEFEVALRLDPHNAVILEKWADFEIAQKEANQAFDRVQQYVSANPNDAHGHLILGVVSSQLRDNKTAQTELERAIEIDPKYTQAYMQLGKLFHAQQQIDRAIASYQKALDLQPNLAPLATMVGNLYLEKGDLKTARTYYSRVLSYDPNFAIANANLAWVDAEEGQDLDLALGMAQKAKSLMPDLPSITDTLAWVMYKKGNYAGALPLLEDCIQKSPNSADFHYHLGLTLIATGEKHEAKDQLEDAMQLKLGGSDGQQARRILAQLD